MLRDKEFDVGISSTSERCLATPPKNNLCEFFRVQPTCGQEYRQEYETHTADSVSDGGVQKKMEEEIELWKGGVK